MSMIRNNILHLDSDYGEDWMINIYLPNVFPTTKKWMRDFDKKVVRKSRQQYEYLSVSVWEEIVMYLESYQECVSDRKTRKKLGDNISFIKEKFIR